MDFLFILIINIQKKMSRPFDQQFTIILKQKNDENGQK